MWNVMRCRPIFAVPHLTLCCFMSDLKMQKWRTSCLTVRDLQSTNVRAWPTDQLERCFKICAVDLVEAHSLWFCSNHSSCTFFVSLAAIARRRKWSDMYAIFVVVVLGILTFRSWLTTVRGTRPIWTSEAWTLTICYVLALLSLYWGPIYFDAFAST